MRHLSLLVGNCVPADDSYWEMFLTFLNVVDIVCSSKISSQTLVDLELTLQELFNEFKILYPHHPITPKFHYLLMYPRFIRKIGPLIHYSCMRFEAKHKTLKNIISRENNYKNAPHSIALQHQMYLATQLSDHDIFRFYNNPTNGTICKRNNFFASFKQIPLISENVTQIDKIVVDGIKYSEKLNVCIGVSNEYVPEFIVIQKICVDMKNECWLVGRKLETLHFHEHFHAWCVQVAPVHAYVCQSQLIYPQPLSLLSPFGVFLHVIRPKFRLEPAKRTAVLE